MKEWAMEQARLESREATSASDEAVRLAVLAYLENRSLLIAANRAPVKFVEQEDGTLSQERGAGGLVTALMGLAQHVDATWVACARTPADAAWRSGRVQLGAPDRDMRVAFINPDPEEYEGYYNQIANPLLWFLQHSMWNLPRMPVIDRLTWDSWNHGYLAVNRQFAQEIAYQVRTAHKPALVMLQDYHLYVTPRYIRDSLPPQARPALSLFVHIPWPGPEYWQILPPGMRHALLDGLCGADLLGFQTHTDAQNFLRTCEMFLPKAHPNLRHRRVWYRNHATHVRDFPISIDVAQLIEFAASPEVERHLQEIHEVVGDRQLILRIDRIEPSKNIVRGFLAYEQFLDLHPEHRGKVVFLAILVPSRMGLDEYTDYLDQLNATAGRVNATHGTSEWEPVRLLVGENYARAVAGLRKYDALLVNSIADGMNLVAKEGPVVNEHSGVLILSERTGAHQQLGPGSITVSPCDVYATAEAMHQALTMPLEEREKRAHRLRWIIETNDLYRWLYDQVDTARQLGM
jgi:trehalose 6-phosphate synthase